MTVWPIGEAAGFVVNLVKPVGESTSIELRDRFPTRGEERPRTIHTHSARALAALLEVACQEIDREAEAMARRLRP